MTSSLSQVTKATGSSHSQLYPILNQTRQEINWRQQGSKISLGIDEHSFKGRGLVLTVTNLTKRKLLYVGEDCLIETVREFLRKVPKHKVLEICIDMKAGYLNAILEVLPGVSVVVDKFHVVAYANHILDQIRSLHLKKKHVKILLLMGKEKLNQQNQIKLAELFEQFKQFPSGFRNINHYIAKVMLAFAPLLLLVHHTY